MCLLHAMTKPDGPALSVWPWVLRARCCRRGRRHLEHMASQWTSQPSSACGELANAAAGALVMAQIGTADQEWLRDWEKKQKEALERLARSLV